MTLAVVAAVLCVVLVLAGASMGLTGSLAFSQPSPSGSPSPSGPVGEPGEIFLLNPHPSYMPALALREPPENPQEPQPPRVSDEFDGVSEGYHIVAAVKDPPPTALVEAYYTPNGESEITIGQLAPVPGSDDTFELDWDISEATIPAGYGTIAVRLFEQTPTGFDEISNDEVAVRMQHEPSTIVNPNTGQAEPTVPESETVELTWPSQAGPLGFYKGAGASALWRTVVSGRLSPGDTQANQPTDQVRIFYSTAPIGKTPAYVACVTASTSAGGPGGSRTFNATCPLGADVLPSQVTAVAALALQDQDPNPVVANRTAESGDAHRIQPYLQDVEDLNVDLTTATQSDSGLRRHITQGPSSGSCLAYRFTIRDALDRPVQGANVDIHLRGPDDQVQFGDEASTTGTTSSTEAVPAKGHSKEAGRDCDGNGPWEEQADHNVPGGNDVKHIETSAGSGLSAGGGVSAGQFLFHVWSPVVGDTEITAWVDDEPLTVESEKREADDDILGASEVRDSNFAQWLPSAPAVTIDPAGATAGAGTCQRFVVRVRGGTRAVRGANVDVHATGPSNDLDFCDPGDGSARRAPDGGTGHNAEDAGEMAHAGQPPVAQHTEGVTDDQGNFVIGISSPVPGDTTISAWYDAGEDGFDDDEPGGATGTATINWVESTADSAISFLNPSSYGPNSEGTQVSKTQDVDAAYHLVARVASIVPVAGVEFFVRTGSNPLVKIADGQQVGQTDVYEAYWPVDVADGPHTLVARIAGTVITVEQAVTVNNNPPSPPDPRDVPFETAEITVPLNGARGVFTRGALTVKGVTSAGTEGLDLFYTKASAISTPPSSAWISCGFAPAPSGSAPKEFTGECRLQGGDQPGQVTGVAALPYDCVQAGCNAAPGAGPGGTRNPGARDSGDAHRIFGVDANPVLAMEPAETASDIGPCQKFAVTLTDQTGQPIAEQNLDAHLTGPGNSGNFCAPEDGTGTPRRAPDLGGHTADGDETDEAFHDEGGVRTHHTEGETTSNGRFIFGIESETAGDAQLTVWLDDGDDDEFDQGETSDVSIMHWEAAGVCDITGTDGPDELEGTDGGERICGFGGDDLIRGGGGEDVIIGGAGDDVLRGQLGDDQVFGSAGGDRVVGGAGMDRLGGGGGPDIVKGHRSNDRLRGNRGNDRVNGGPGRDDCSGGGGRDRLRKCETGTTSFAARTRPI